MLKKWINESIALLDTKGLPDQRGELEMLVEHVCGISRANLYLHDDALSAEAQRTLDKLLQRLLNGEPIQHLIGEVEFYGLKLSIDHRALVPRPETEWIVDRIVQNEFESVALNIVDLCSGSGCIALALKKAFPKSNVRGFDLSADALDLSAENARSNQLDVTFSPIDITADEASAQFDENSIDVLVSNPPYIPRDEIEELPSNVRDFEPLLALSTGNEPLRFYRAISKIASTALKFGGRLYLECHEDYASQVLEYLEKEAFSELFLEKDLAGKDRFVWGRK